MVIKFFTELLNGLTSQDMRNSLPFNCVEVQGHPGFFHFAEGIVHAELAEGKVRLLLQELNVILGVFHHRERLLRDVSLRIGSNFLGHL